jgi:heme a synthase
MRDGPRRAEGDARAVRAPVALRAVLLVNLAAQVGIVVTGGLVRLTGSGLGCPTWPQCVPGSYTPVVRQAQGYHKYIEFGNRLLVFLVAAAALATLVAVLRFARARSVVVLGAVPLLGVVAQAVLGGVTVLTGLSPATVAAHFLLSMVLVAASTALLLLVTAPTPPSPRREVRLLSAAVAALASVVLVIGTVVTGSGPHSGDATKPARLGFDPAAVSRLHAGAVWLFVLLVLALVLVQRRAGASRQARRRGAAVLIVTLGQGVVGYVQYATGLPAAIVATHLLGASLLVVAVTAAVASAVGLGRTGATS